MSTTEKAVSAIKQAANRFGNTTVFPLGLPLPLAPDSPKTKYWLQRIFQKDPKDVISDYRALDSSLKRVMKDLKRKGIDDPVRQLFFLLSDSLTRADVLDNPNMGTAHSLEAGILRLYRPGGYPDKFNHGELRGQVGWWGLVEDNTVRMKPEQLALLQTLPSVFGELADWDKHSEEHRELLTLSVFALGSLLNEPLVLDAAVKTQHKMAEQFEFLSWMGPDDETIRYVPIPDLILVSTQNDDANPFGQLIAEIKFLYRDITENEPTVCRVISRIRALHQAVARDEEKFSSLMAEAVKDEIEQLREVNTGMEKGFQQTGIELPIDVPFYCRTIEQRALPVVEFDHADRCIAVIRELKRRMRCVMADSKKTLESIITRNAELKSIAQTPSANISRIAELSAEILSCQERLRTELETLRPLLIIPPVISRPGPTRARPEEPAAPAVPVLAPDPDAEKLALLGDIEQLQRELSERNAEIYRLKHRYVGPCHAKADG